MPKPRQRRSGIAPLLGKRVREHRLSQGMTQGQLAEKVGVETETISRLERGTTLPSLLKIEELANTLHVSLTDLIGGSSTLVSDQALQIEKLLHGLNENDRSLILKVARIQREHLLNRS